MLAALLGTIAFSASKVVYGKSAVGRIRVGVVLPEKDELSAKVMSIVEEMESVRSICDLVDVDLEEGKRMLETGEMEVLLVIPDEMIEGIIYGANIPATVILPKSQGLEPAIFKELADSGAKILGIAQAAIYAADNFCVLHGLEGDIPEVNADLNKLFLKYSLNRNGYFNDYRVSATGEVTPVEFYGISAFVLFLLLCGIPASMVVRQKGRALGQMLGMMGIGRWKQTAGSLLSVLFLLLTAALGVMAAACGAGAVAFSAGLVGAVFAVCLAASAMTVFLYELAGNPIAGVMAVFFCSVVMMFVAGGLIPAVFLPAGMARFSDAMPAGWMMDAVRLAMTSSAAAAVSIKLFASAAVFYIAAALVRRH